MIIRRISLFNTESLPSNLPKHSAGTLLHSADVLRCRLMLPASSSDHVSREIQTFINVNLVNLINMNELNQLVKSFVSSRGVYPSLEQNMWEHTGPVLTVWLTRDSRVHILEFKHLTRQFPSIQEMKAVKQTHFNLLNWRLKLY